MRLCERLQLVDAELREKAYPFLFDRTNSLEEPVEMAGIQISPGERVEVMVPVEPGETTRLNSIPPDLAMKALLERFNGGDDTFDLLEIRAADQLVESPPLPSALTTIETPDRDEAARVRQFELSGFTQINEKEMDMARIDAVITKNTTEIWELHNAANTYHNFHVHDVHFSVLDIDGHQPPAHLRGWKDTIFLPPGVTARIIADFEDYADPTLPFMFRCHILAHEDAGMMGQFVVVETDP